MKKYLFSLLLALYSGVSLAAEPASMEAFLQLPVEQQRTLVEQRMDAAKKRTKPGDEILNINFFLE